MWNPTSDKSDQAEVDPLDPHWLIEANTALRFDAERHPERYNTVDASDPDWYAND